MASEDDMARLKRLEVKVERLEEAVERLDEKTDRLEGKMDGLGIQFEQVRTDIKKLGEGYDAGMRRIAEEIKDLGRRWDAKWAPHDLAIRNHGTRITALEQRRSRRG